MKFTMKKLDTILVRDGRMIRFALSVLALVFLAASAGAAQLRAARVTQIIKDVRLLPGQATPRTAALNDNVNPGTAVRTGNESRTELTFADLTITRLGADTVFSFNEGSRELSLNSGAMLVEVPRNGAEVTITTSAVSAGITGGTALFESNKGLPTKLLVLEGTGRFYPKGHPEQAVIVQGGEMVMMTINGHITRATKFNAGLVYKTAKLITSFPALPNADLILAVIQEQQALQTGAPSSPPRGGGEVAIKDQAVSATVAPATGGSKFGPPSVIKFPNPYLITSGTAINTDPMITTNGKTDFGKLYRGQVQDGPFTPWIGTSPTSFDTAFGDNFQPDRSLPLAIFLFSSLQLDGNPTISNSNNYPSLGLVSQGGITSSPSGAVFTFGGVFAAALAALNGSIDLSGISFANFGELFVYARGSGSNLTLAAPISNLNRVQLRAGNDIQVTSPVTVNGTVPDHRGFRAQAGNNLQIASTVKANQMEIQSLVSIQIKTSAQLLAMLSSTGSSGQILIEANGSDGSVSVGGLVQADKGELDIRDTGVNGQVTLNSATLRGDVVKVSALGTNGVLNIGAGNSLNADTVLKLYATGSNGTLNFLSNVTLSSPSNILAANTINIAQGAVVTVNSVNMAEVYTNNPNYFGFGGNAVSPAAAGTFGGAGAKNPLPLSNAPPLGPPGGGP